MQNISTLENIDAEGMSLGNGIMRGIYSMIDHYTHTFTDGGRHNVC